MTLIKTLPTIVSAFRESVKSFGKGGARRESAIRTERDLGHGPRRLRLARRSRSSSRSCRTFRTAPSRARCLMGAARRGLRLLLRHRLVAHRRHHRHLVEPDLGHDDRDASWRPASSSSRSGWTGDVYQAVALCVGAIVCIAAANAGATSQDLKTGYLVGATPRRQQIGFIIGVLISTLVIGGTLFLLDKTYADGRAPRHRRSEARGAAGDAHGDDHQGPAREEPAVGARPRRRRSSRSWRRWPARTPSPGPSAPTCRSRRRSRSGSAA